MRIKLAFLFLASVTTGACSYTPGEPVPQRGIIPVNVPVVSRADYSFDAMTQGGQLPPTETARLDGWFRGLGLGYGDAIFVDGPMAEAARSDVAGVAGRYGLMLSAGAPVTVGAIMDGSVRVVVSRTRASVPSCPNWSEPASPTYQNKMSSNFGCAVNSNLAAMVANPQDLVYGRDGGGLQDAAVSSRAVEMYRTAPPTGKKGLEQISTTSGGGSK